VLSFTSHDSNLRLRRDSPRESLDILFARIRGTQAPHSAECFDSVNNPQKYRAVTSQGLSWEEITAAVRKPAKKIKRLRELLFLRRDPTSLRPSEKTDESASNVEGKVEV
jgi:hypothetical protein